jgi:hypothetical protein
MHYPESVEPRAGGLTAAFTLDWYNRHWTSRVEHEIADFPFIAEVFGKRERHFVPSEMVRLGERGCARKRRRTRR